MESLTGRIALISGGGTGIGRGIAVALARAGAKVALCGRRAGPLDETLAEIRAAQGDGLGLQADVSDESDVARLVQQTIGTLGAIDILVNNAAIGGGDEIHSHDLAAWDRVLKVNLRGAFLLAHFVLPHMRRQGRGDILNISSESGLEHYPGDGAYGTSKHALNELSELIQRENQEYGIRVATICPGMVVTEMTRDSPGLDHAKCLLPEDIADLALWLLTRQRNIKIGTPILIQTMENPWT
jgi:NAD(P)-dependent dehydrogenase (short-subunit alcohol dehydrogenase family)